MRSSDIPACVGALAFWSIAVVAGAQPYGKPSLWAVHPRFADGVVPPEAAHVVPPATSVYSGGGGWTFQMNEVLIEKSDESECEPYFITPCRWTLTQRGSPFRA